MRIELSPSEQTVYIDVLCLYDLMQRHSLLAIHYIIVQICTSYSTKTEFLTFLLSLNISSEIDI